MRVNSPEVQQALHWWRKQPFWRKALMFLQHFDAWMSLKTLDKVDRQRTVEMKRRVFGSK